MLLIYILHLFLAKCLIHGLPVFGFKVSFVRRTKKHLVPYVSWSKTRWEPLLYAVGGLLSSRLAMGIVGLTAEQVEWEMLNLIQMRDEKCCIFATVIVHRNNKVIYNILWAIINHTKYNCSHLWTGLLCVKANTEH